MKGLKYLACSLLIGTASFTAQADILVYNQKTETREGVTNCMLSIYMKVGDKYQELFLSANGQLQQIKTDKPVYIEKAVAVCNNVESFEYEFKTPIEAKPGNAIAFLGHKESQIVTYTVGAY